MNKHHALAQLAPSTVFGAPAALPSGRLVVVCVRHRSHGLPGIVSVQQADECHAWRRGWGGRWSLQ